ncbi:MAG: hypothetical protein VXY66_07095, partial [Pseudomonadota bacterium]|nr:hypothetical protein [Pseudomonadota bacterium]
RIRCQLLQNAHAHIPQRVYYLIGATRYKGRRPRIVNPRIHSPVFSGWRNRSSFSKAGLNTRSGIRPVTMVDRF